MRSKYIPEDALVQIRALLAPSDRYLTDFLLATGFRLDDVLHLRRWQLSQGELTLKERKTGKVRSISIPPELQLKLNQSGENSRGCALRFAFPALRSGGKGKMHRTTYWRHFRAAVTAAGYEGRGFSPHSLRKVYAVRLFNRKGLKAVQEDLGHTYESTTMLYVFSDMID